jgi:AcrR family transcriptional regulator
MPPTTPTSPGASAPAARSNPSEDLRAVATELFASAGYAGTSLQQIADAAGYSKSSVLYHFASKEALLDAVLGPAIDRLESVLVTVADLAGTPRERAQFVERFIDFLFDYRLEVHTFINQGQSLIDIPVIDRANATVSTLAESFSTDFTSVEEKVRFGVALGGAAYTLVAGANFAESELPLAEVRRALVATVSDLLTPVRPHRSSR